MSDLWHEGYACGTRGRSWLDAVLGRFLRSWERAALAAGWREGQLDAETYRADMAARADLCDDQIPF